MEGGETSTGAFRAAKLCASRRDVASKNMETVMKIWLSMRNGLINAGEDSKKKKNLAKLEFKGKSDERVTGLASQDIVF